MHGGTLDLDDVRVADKELRSAIERAVKATGRAAPATERPQLLFLERADAAPDAEETWVTRVLREPEAEAFTGPFVLDRAHPLTDGLSLSGVVWGGGKSPLSGAPVVMADDSRVAYVCGGRFLLRPHRLRGHGDEALALAKRQGATFIVVPSRERANGGGPTPAPDAERCQSTRTLGLYTLR